jgi:hypothetical protein
MTDYVFRNGVSGMMRHELARGAPWIGHPRDRDSQFPHQPRFAISGEAWAEDLATFQALVSANDFAGAYRFADRNGFRVTLDDVPEGLRDAFKTWVQVNVARHQREIIGGDGWQ